MKAFLGIMLWLLADPEQAQAVPATVSVRPAKPVTQDYHQPSNRSFDGAFPITSPRNRANRSRLDFLSAVNAPFLRVRTDGPLNFGSAIERV